MASDDKGKAKGGAGGLVVTVGALTVLAAAGGGLVGKALSSRATAAAASAAQPAKAEKSKPYAGDIEVTELPAVVTNLAQPETARVRLQVALVLPKTGIENPGLLLARVNDDIVAFMKTLSVADLQGPSGLQALREDLNERAAVRSEGKVRELIIENLVVQ